MNDLSIIKVGKLHWVREMLSDGDGAISSTRVAFVVTTFTVLSVWTYVCVKTSTIVDMPMGVSGIILTFMAGKVGQTWLERKQ